MSKKILIYINSMKPAGGIERVVSNLANIWSDKYNINILVKDKEKSFYTLGEKIQIRSIELPIKLNMKNKIQRIYCLFSNLILTNRRLKKYFMSNEYDFIYVTSPFNALEIFLLGKEFFNKLIISEHGSMFAYNKVYKLLKKIIYPRAYKISVPTTLDTDLYTKKGFPAMYIPHLSTFEAKIRNELDTKIVLNIGRLTKDKQQLMLLEIWNEISIKNMLNGWKLIIVGRGEEESLLSNFISKKKLRDSVKILPPQLNVDQIYKQASIFAFTSKFEGFGMVLLEAMSFGIPCISYDCPSGPRDIINEGFNGKLIPSYDKKKYEEELSAWINSDIENLKYYGKNAFEMVESWDNKKILDQWDEVFFDQR